MLKKSIKYLANQIFESYSLYKIFVLRDSTKPEFKGIENLNFCQIEDENLSEQSPEIADQAWYGGSEAVGFACKKGDETVAICWYWYGERYKSRNFWPLKTNEAKLVQITTVEHMRSHGIGRQLIIYSSSMMMELGFERLYARIWHTNHPSIKSFTRAGWEFAANVLEIKFRWSKKARKIVFKSNWGL